MSELNVNEITLDKEELEVFEELEKSKPDFNFLNEEFAWYLDFFIKHQSAKEVSFLIEKETKIVIRKCILLSSLLKMDVDRLTNNDIKIKELLYEDNCIKNFHNKIMKFKKLKRYAKRN